MNLRPLLFCGAALLAALGCGGGGGGGTPVVPRSTTPATKLVFQAGSVDPNTWRLVQNPATSTPTHLVLDLMAPANTSGQGFTVVLTTDVGNAAWAKPDGTNFALQNIFATTPPNVSRATLNASLSDLQIVFGQPQGLVKSFNPGPVVEVALDLVHPGATVGPVTLTATNSGFLGATAPPANVVVALGTVQAE